MSKKKKISNSPKVSKVDQTKQTGAALPKDADISDQNDYGVNIQIRPVCDKIIRNTTGKFRGKMPRYIFVTYVLSNSESQRRSKGDHKVYVWRADDVKLIYADNSEEVCRVLCENDGSDVPGGGDDKRYNRNADPKLVKLVDDNRPHTAPEDTPHAYDTLVHLRCHSERQHYGMHSQTASVIRGLAGIR